MNGRLTTHVLDTAAGRPASGIPIQLFEISDGGVARLLAETTTNEGGRTAEPLLRGDAFRVGLYEIVFHVGAHFGVEGDGPPFLDRIAIRLGISDPDAAYHVPLLVSLWSYSTYRGS